MFGTSDKTVSVKLRAEVTDYKRGMNEAGNSTRQFGRQAQTAVGGSRKEIEGVTRSSGKAATAVKGLAAAGVAMVSFDAVAGYLGDSVEAAADLSQTIDKTRTIFGKSSAEIESWAKTAYDAVGLSEQGAMSAASAFGDMFAQLGETQDNAAKMSKEVIQLAADLGAFNNMDTAEVLDMISASFRGEYDSLQRLIPNINAARVENEALAETGKKSAKELTAQEKAHATLAIVQKDGAKAAGRFADESDTLQGAQQRLNAQMENLTAQLGESLLPVMEDVVNFGNNSFVPFLSAMAKGFESGGSNVGTFSDNTRNGLLWWILEKTNGSIPEAIKKHQELAKAEQDAASAGPPVGSALANIADKARGVKVDMQGLNDELAQFYQLALDARGAERDYEDALDSAAESIKENGRTLNIHTEAGRSNQEALDAIAESAIAMAEANITQGASVDEVKKKLLEQRDAFITTATRMGMSKTEAEKLATQLGLTGGQAQILTDKINGIPEEKTTTVKVLTASAMSAIEQIKRGLKSIQDESVQVTVNRQTYNKPVFATGGPVFGPGTETSDSIPALLSNDEHVLTAREVRAMGGHSAVERLRRAALSGSLPRFASGGAVGMRQSSSFDYDRLAGLMRTGSAPTFNAYGLDAEKAVRKMMDRYMWESRG